ncbi:hypothetical protein L1887_27700 [Cichorium endivia]|nr:hypothetical protein L1887_27700 [Cichorium endivia]
MAANLSAGAISMLSSGDWQTMDLKPVLQVIDLLTVQTQTPTGADGRKCRVLLSDGSFHKQGVLATKCNDLVTSQQLQKGSIVQLTDFRCLTIRERIIIKIIELNVILGTYDIIGDTKPFQLKLPGNDQFIWKTTSQIKDEKLGTFGKPDFITVNATIWHIKHENFCYTTCPIIYDLQLQIHDHTGFAWITAYEETAEEMMGISAKDLYIMKEEEENEDNFMETVHGVLFTEYNFKLKVKEEFLFGEPVVRSVVVKAEKMKFSSNTKNLLVEVSSVSEV